MDRAAMAAAAWNAQWQRAMWFAWVFWRFHQPRWELALDSGGVWHGHDDIPGSPAVQLPGALGVLWFSRLFDLTLSLWLSPVHLFGSIYLSIFLCLYLSIYPSQSLATTCLEEPMLDGVQLLRWILPTSVVSALGTSTHHCHHLEDHPRTCK